MTSSLPTIPAISPEPSALPAVPEETVKQQQITIKEITPVSEIPVITDVKIKEILPSPSIEVAEYSSSKSPLIPREATSEKSINTNFETPKPEQEMPSVVEVHSTPETVSTEESKTSTENKGAPSKISLSTQDSINSEIYPSPIVPIIATMGSPSVTPDTRPVASTTKAPILEEDDPSLFDHNPAFPPLPDDLSVLSNHGEEIVPEPSADTEHIPVEHTPMPTSTEAVVKESLTTTAKYLPNTFVSTTERSSEAVTEFSTIPEPASTSAPFVRENPTIKLRSAIPTDILRASSVEVTEGKATANRVIVAENAVTQAEENHDIVTQTSTTLPVASTTTFSTTTEAAEKPEEITTSEETFKSEGVTTDEPKIPYERVSFITTGAEPEPELQSTTQKEISITTQKEIVSPTTEASSNTPQDQTTSSIAKSNIATEVTSQTELSSLPIETSDQNPHESSASDNVSKDTFDFSTADPLSDLSTTNKQAYSSEIKAVAKADSRAIENVETTEFILTPFDPSESSTDAVELIKIPGDSGKNAAIIDVAAGANKNAFTDLIKLVSDVASMSDHTAAPLLLHQVALSSYSDSEELIPVNNRVYKNKNNNFNQNSITEVPFKTKGVSLTKQKVVEIEDDESAGITDSLPPNDKVEPTTRRPIIDNVSDDMHEIKTEKKDIEIITQSYVPTINRRPTKIIEKVKLSEEMPQDDAPAASASSEMVTESSESVTGSSLELSGGSVELTTAAAEAANATLSAEQ